MATNHDLLMKELIAAFPDQFLSLAAPYLAERVDLRGVHFEPEEHFAGSPTGHARRCDLVARSSTQWSDGRQDAEEQVLLHIEIELRYQSTVEPKLLRYHRGLSLKHGLPVHTTVLFLRGGPAGSRERIYEERSVGRLIGTIGYTSLGLSQGRAVKYLKRPEPLAWALAALMKPSRGQTRSQLGLACVLQIAGDSRIGTRDRRLLVGCVLTYASLEDDDAQEFDRIMAGLDDEGVQNVRMSMTQRWRREGLEQGRADGARDLVKRMLARRFGKLSAESQRRLSAIVSSEDLARLAEKVYQVETLEELGLA